MKPSKPASRYGANASAASAGVAAMRLARRSGGMRAMSASASRTSFTSSTGAMTVRMIVDGSRPTASQWACSTSFLCFSSSSEPHQLEMSPNRATIRSVRFSPLPPMRILGPPGWMGRGLLSARSSR